MLQNHPQNLTGADLSSFEQLGISIDLLALAGVCRVTDSEARSFGIRYSATSDLSGIIFPYRRPGDGQRVTSRLRRDTPEVENGKSQNKYILEYGNRQHLYFPPAAEALLADINIPVIIAEAEKSVLAITAWAQRISQRVLAIGCGGCWGWRGKIGKRPLPNGDTADEKGLITDFHLIQWAGRDVVICFDSNAATNDKVRMARSRLAATLIRMGARVRIGNVPSFPGVNGPDDLIGSHGDTAMTELITTAQPMQDVIVADAEAAVAALSHDSSVQQQDAAFSLLANIESAIQREAVAAKFGKRTGLARKPVAERLASIRRQMETEAVQAAEAARQASLRARTIAPESVINSLCQFFDSHAYLPNGGALVLALWTLNTWLYDVFKTTPYLLLKSPTKNCGKSTVLDLLNAVVQRPYRLVVVSPAVLFRIVERERPTLLLDEAEAMFGLKGRRDEQCQAVQAIANAGYKAGNKVARCAGDDHEIQYFEVFSPKSFAVIGNPSGALVDRCIVVSLERKPDHVTLAPNRENVLEAETAPLRSDLEAYAIQHRDRLTDAYNSEPVQGYWTQLKNRELELWSPLLLHARLTSPTLEREALETALAFSAQKLQQQATERDFLLIRELVTVLHAFNQPEFKPSDLVAKLAKAENWVAYLDQKRDPAKPAAVASFLRRFNLKSRHTNSGSVYSVKAVLEKLEAHLPVGMNGGAA